MKLENYIENIYRDLSDFENLEYKDLYKSFKHDKLINIFSTLHYLIVTNFKLMNQRLPTLDTTAHFWAEPSRELIKAIDHSRSLESSLKNTIYSFSINKDYNIIMKKVSLFLSSSGGSEIPMNMEKIELYYLIPLFVSDKIVTIDSNEKKRSSSKKLIGEGAYAFVYKYHDNFYNRNFVIKTAKKDLAEDELKRFKIEFDYMRELNSPYIVEVYKYIEENNEYIMEFMDQDLHEYINQINSNISKSVRINIIKQILKGMSHIHSKELLHRDLSPKNILLRTYDDVIVVKISDLGLVKNPENEMTNLDTNIKGYFNDIEGLSRVGFSNYKIEHETFALTKVITFILTGKINYSNIKDEQIKNFINKGTSPNLEDRFTSIAEIYKYLVCFLDF